LSAAAGRFKEAVRAIMVRQGDAVKTAALIVAGGRGTRAGGALPKQYTLAGGLPILRHTLATFLDHPDIDAVQVVIARGDEEHYHRAADLGSGKLLAPVLGGGTRHASVYAGLTALEPRAPGCVLIHDAVRPFVPALVINRVLAALNDAPAALAALPLTDTLKRLGPGGHVDATIERAGLWRAQTPQGFHFRDILAAHRAAAAAGREDLSDDAAVAEWAGMAVAVVAGSAANRKLTTAEDLVTAAHQLAPVPDVRTGNGFDVHRLVAGDHVWLCGVKLAHSQGLEGHSDADVGLHALTDALLGAIGDGDIGQHFPNSDPRWRGAASHLFLSDAARRVRALGGMILNLDVTILCEAPKIAPHRNAMRQRVAEIAAIDVGRTAVKATTTEGLGFAGRREGIAALASATICLGLPRGVATNT
jgi:2-C-methyl-D-erythritol 4-phosphate cytidylyltransferase / 2-C-methyl-D-erythritol 2,4-cyclodiphosphate synthase